MQVLRNNPTTQQGEWRQNPVAPVAIDECLLQEPRNAVKSASTPRHGLVDDDDTTICDCGSPATVEHQGEWLCATCREEIRQASWPYREGLKDDREYEAGL